MDEKYVKSILEGLKSTSSSRVQDTLLKIRSKIIGTDSGIKLFRECGGLECLLPHLRRPNEKILDVSLSILGNCCLEEESSLLVGKLLIFAPLISILNTVCRDSIVGRTCRVIGNLAQKSSNAESLHNNGAVSALVTLIQNRNKNTSHATLTMAVRAIRQLWMITEKREEMLAINTVRCIAILLTTECESALINPTAPKIPERKDILKKSQEELITGILKCIGYFTTHATVPCAEQIQGDGRGYQCLVSLTGIFESLALKCLMNLCYLSTCRPLLGTAGLIECLVAILQNISDVSGWPDGAARALAHLSGESVNRSRLRHCGGLPLVMAAARTNSNCLHALLQYVFDDTSFQILLNEGLIDLLTKELLTYLSTMDFEHTNKDNNTELGLTDEKSKEKLKCNSKSDNDLSNVKEKGTLLTHFKGPYLNKNEDELKVVIERDNMIVGFVDAPDSDVSDESQSEDENTLKRRISLKRHRSKSPKLNKKKSKLIKLASRDWSASVYWEPKSPEWSLMAQTQGSRSVTSPESLDVCPLSPYSDGNQSGFSPQYRGFSSSKRPKQDWSPNSDADGSSSSAYWSEYQWSPSSSRSPTSPFSINENSSDSEVSDRYSPICSDNEAIENEVMETKNKNLTELDAAQVANDLDDLIMEDDDSVDENALAEGDTGEVHRNTRYSRIACVLVLLFRVSHGVCSSYCALREEPLPNHALELLTGKECINALLDYIERCKKPWGRVARILARILSNTNCLKNILKHRLALRLHKMSTDSKHPPTKCQQCKQVLKISTNLLTQLTILAESSYGIGEISYQLLKGSGCMKQTLSLTLSYIVRNEKPLKTYFVDCNALNLLFTIITESKEDINDCITALVKLAINAHIKDPKTLENRFKETIVFDYEKSIDGSNLDNLSNENVVTFELDDLSTVKANRLFLCRNSDVFRAMLQGCFKESVEACVKLRNVTKPALEYLLALLHCGLNDIKTIDVFPMAEKLETNLEVLLLADRFLFQNLKALLSSAILQFQLTPETADKIYVWSLSEGMGFLCVESVAYLLVGKMNEVERTRSFQSILELEYKEQWLDDIKAMILRQLVK